MRYDLLIQNGTVVDPAQGWNGIRDVAIREGKIALVEPGLESADAAQVVDAAGCHVFPGLIDFHLHLFDGVSELAVPPDAACLPCGVTTAVDAGSAGVANIAAFQADVVERAHVRVKSFLNVCPTGLGTIRFHEDVDPAHFDSVKIRRAFERYPQTLLALKIRSSAEIVGEMGYRPLERTLEIAEEIGCPVVVHATNPPPAEGSAGILRRLRAGDVFCHVFHGKGAAIVRDGNVIPEAADARRRGVLFDAANGGNHFDFAVARAAIAAGFLPDVISTDLTSKTLYRPGAVMSLPFVMSKYLNMGVPLPEIVRRTTEIPARLMQASGRIGTLRPGAMADIAVFRIIDKQTHFEDWKGETLTGDQLLQPLLTVVGGSTLYRQIDF